MSKYPAKIDRAAAERLLRGEPADPRHPDDLLAVLLATAAAPAHAGELAGEEAAVVAFRQARAAAAAVAARPGDEAPAPTERSWNPAPARRWLRHPVWLAVAALTATTAGGVAMAAGSVPWSGQPADQRPAPGSASPSQPARPGAGHGQVQGGASATSPHPSFVGLCNAYQAAVGTAPGKALENPAFTSLIKAAGGRDKVPAYCAEVLAAAGRQAKKSVPPNPAATPDHQPDKSGRPDKSGQDRPKKHETVSPTPSVSPPVTTDSADPAESRRQSGTPQPASGTPQPATTQTATPQPGTPQPWTSQTRLLSA